MSAKSDLIERLKKLDLGVPEFEVRVTGPDHEPVFSAEVSVEGRLLARGEGRTKRDAERAASEAALALLSRPQGGQDGPQGGPWPIYADVLSQALLVAHERVSESAGVDEVRRAAAQLYAGLLSDLGVEPEALDPELAGPDPE